MSSVSPPASGQVARLVAGHRGLDGIRRAVTDPFAYGAEPLLAHCLPRGSRLVAPRLLRTRYAPGRELAAYYAFAPGRNQSSPRHLALTWSTQPADLAATAVLEREAEVRGLVEPFERLVAASADGCLTLVIAPIDPAFPRLVRHYESGYVTATAASLAGVRTGADREVRALRYRPGSRHVLRVRTSAEDSAIVKLYRDDTGARTVAVAAAMDALLPAAVPGVRPARSLGYVPADRAAWWSEEPGEALWRRLPDVEAGPLLRTVGRALRVLHDTDPSAFTSSLPPAYVTSAASSAPESFAHLPARGTDAELAATTRAAEHIQGLLPRVGGRLRDVVARIGDGLAARPAESPTLTHGDLTCDNLLTTSDQVRLIDLDRTGFAEPALDLGKFVADLWWWCAELGLPAGPAVTAFVDGYGDCGRDRLARAHGLAVLFHLSLAARRVPVHHPEWAHQVARAVRQAEDAVAGGGKMSGGGTATATPRVPRQRGPSADEAGGPR
ncbi:aminoglycoside phosphotransferase family protein [Actinopolymorpha sp. NPDC004070]|uniref:aminoglycoside phosphotransferase family protein n=1 Tax=Actinopolymorpha sp. NPDC004070 TaxID=3154548 RepID=UPI0033BE8150